MDKPQSNQATANILGFVYQVLVAIETCFDADINQTIYIECFGDVATGNASTEVKHHFNDGNLTNNSVDFWKTLKNLVNENTSKFEKLYLHTTQSIPETGIFSGWNNKTPTAKYNALKKHDPADSIKEFHELIFSKKRAELLPILAKFELIGSQQKIEEYAENLLKHQILLLAPNEERRDILWWLHGFMFDRAIRDRYLWHVDINQFREDLSGFVSQFQKSGVEFPYVKASDVEAEDKKDFLFVKELESIGVRKGERVEAVSDYLRMKLSEIDLITKKPILMEQSVERFEGEVHRRVTGCKARVGRKLSTQDLNTDRCKEASLEAFDEFSSSQKLNLTHVENTEYYFMTGKVHHLVELSDLTWNYKFEELE